MYSSVSLGREGREVTVRSIRDLDREPEVWEQEPEPEVPDWLINNVRLPEDWQDPVGRLRNW